MHRIRAHPIAATLLLVLLIASVALGGSAWVVWRAAHRDAASQIDRADAIVVLGAAQYDGEPSPVFRGRLDHAALLWDQHRADIVITLGAKQPGDNMTEAESGRRYLAARGVPSGSLVALPVGHTTLGSMRAAARYLKRQGFDSAFLVSDPWHNARIDRMADDLGLDGHASATWSPGATSQESRSQGYLRETLAYLFYRVTGR